MNEKPNDLYSFNILPEEAVSEDAFAHRTHENVAKTLSSLITQKGSKGQTIGLEGSWGSGKSTVVSILKSKLKSTDSLYFYFDAWAHEGDPLRRVFLESLIAQIGLDDPDLKALSEQISNRRKTTKTTTHKHATFPGKVLALSALLVPLGVGIVSGIDYSSLTLKWTGHINIMFIIGTLLSIMPFITLPISAVWLKKHKQVGVKDLIKLKNWSFLESNSNDVTTQEISEDEERSSIEFEGFFTTIMENVFSKKTNNKLVMVIDNLDRINPADTLKIWSTLQTFLQNRNPSNTQASWTDNIWIIVPYDQEGLSKVWDSNGAEDTCSKHFFNKCFQLRLEVPKPILTDWKMFAEQMLEQAIGNWPEEDKRDVIEVFSLTRESLNDIPTPREIKTYINQVGALRQHAHKEVKTTSIAYYVVQRFLKHTSVGDIRKGLIEKTLPAANHKYLLPSCEKNLAALVFGVNPTTGQQLLLEPTIEKALKNGDGSELGALCEKHADGFWAVFNHHISRMDLSAALWYSKAVLDGLWKDYRPKCREFTDKVKEVKMTFPSSEDFDVYEAHIKLMVDSKNNATKLWPQITSDLMEKFDDKGDFTVSENVDILRKIILSFGDLDLRKCQFHGTNLERWIEWASASQTHEMGMHKWIIPPESLCKSLAEKIKPGVAITAGVIEVFRYCLDASLTVWTPMVEACKEHIHWSNGSTNETTTSITSFEILLALAMQDKDQKLNIQPLIDAGQFHNCVFHLKDNGAVIYSALLMARYHGDDLHSVNIPAVGNAAQGTQLMRDFWKTSDKNNAEKIWNLLKTHNQQRLLWKLVENTDNKLVGNIILLALDQKDSELFKVKDALPKLRAARLLIEDPEEDNEKALLQCFTEFSELINEIKAQENLDVPKFSYELNQVVSENLDEAVIRNISSQMQALEKADWEQALTDNNYLTSLALILKKESTDFSLGNSYYDAFYDFSEGWCTGKNKEPTVWQKDNWDALVNIMGVSFRTQFTKKLTIAFRKNLSGVSQTFFSANKQHVDIELILRDDVSTFQSTLEASLQNKGDFERIKMLAAMLESDQSNVFKAEGHFPDVINEPLNKLFLATEDDKQKELLELIATKFKIPIEEPKKQTDEDTGSATEANA